MNTTPIIDEDMTPVSEVDFRITIGKFSHSCESWADGKRASGRCYTIYGTQIVIGFATDDGRYLLNKYWKPL